MSRLLFATSPLCYIIVFIHIVIYINCVILFSFFCNLLLYYSFSFLFYILLSFLLQIILYVFFLNIAQLLFALTGGHHRSAARVPQLAMSSAFQIGIISTPLARFLFPTKAQGKYPS